MCPHGVGGVSGISESYADFTGTAGTACVREYVHMKSAWIHVLLCARVILWLHVCVCLTCSGICECVCCGPPQLAAGRE